MPGPIGPPGFNGSQGAAGSKGAANLSSCQYVKKGAGFTVGHKYITVNKIEPTVSIADKYVFCFQNEICCICFDMLCSQ